MAVWVVLGLPACGYTPVRNFSNVCPSTDVGLCDVRVRACQEQVGHYIACLAEREFTEIPEVITSTRTRPIDPYAPWLDPLRPALLALRLTETTTTALPIEPWDFGRGVIERSELPAYDDREAVIGLGFAMALALYDQTEGWSEALQRRSDFDAALALRCVWTGVALLWADHLDAALAGLSYFDRGPGVPKVLPGIGLERDALNYERRFGGSRFSREWTQNDEVVRRWVDAPPGSVGALTFGDRGVAAPVSDRLILPRPTLVVLAHGALGPSAFEVWRYPTLQVLGRSPIGDRLFLVEDTRTGVRGGLWVLRFQGDGVSIAAHPDPVVRDELRAAGDALLEP
ncbi:MAG: hypothetical protein IPG45_19110 [Deltaproteobacteria bacterium]|nr:hypothetical protein [Deltaproteobacteria bacterium]